MLCSSIEKVFREGKWDAVLFPLLGRKPRDVGEQEVRQNELHQALDAGDDLSEESEESESSDEGSGKGGSEPEDGS